MQLEICVFSLEAAIKASQSGADRIELCANPADGGTTPSIGLIKAVRKITNLKIFPIIRPRGGNFCYSDAEFEIMKEDIKFAKECGCDGIATGILNRDHTVDEKRLKELVMLADPLEVTFIRAFDLTPDPQQALFSILESGCRRILTSGQANKALQALPLLKKLVTIANNKISIMAGSGINSENVKSIIEQTGVQEIHASVRTTLANDHPSLDLFGFGKQLSCDEEQIVKMRKILDTF